MADLPIVCTLQPAELKQRREGLLPGLASTARRCVPIEGGYRFEFAPSRDTLSEIVGVIDAERQCCRFLRFQFTVEPDEGAVQPDGSLQSWRYTGDGDRRIV